MNQKNLFKLTTIINRKTYNLIIAQKKPKGVQN